MIKQRKLEYSEDIICSIETIDFSEINLDDIFGYNSNYYIFK